jgi:hypothetical protein
LSLLFRSSDYSFVWISYFFYASYILRPSHPFLFDHPNYLVNNDDDDDGDDHVDGVRVRL